MTDLVMLVLWAGFVGWLVVFKWMWISEWFATRRKSEAPVFRLLARMSSCFFCVGFWLSLPVAWAVLGASLGKALVMAGGAAWMAGQINDWILAAGQR